MTRLWTLVFTTGAQALKTQSPPPPLKVFEDPDNSTAKGVSLPPHSYVITACQHAPLS